MSAMCGRREGEKGGVDVVKALNEGICFLEILMTLT